MRLFLLLSLLPALLQAIRVELVQGNSTKTIEAQCPDQDKPLCYYGYVKYCCEKQKNQLCRQESKKVLCRHVDTWRGLPYCKKSYEELEQGDAAAATEETFTCSAKVNYVVRDWPVMPRSSLKTQPYATNMPWEPSSPMGTVQPDLTTPSPVPPASISHETNPADTTSSALVKTTDTAATLDPNGSGSNTPVALAPGSGGSGQKSNTGMIIVVSLIAGMVVIIGAISLVVWLKKRKHKGTDKVKPKPTKKKKKNQPRKAPGIAKALVGNGGGTPKVATKKAASKKQKKEKESHNIEPGVIDKDHFEFVGPLLFRAGQSKPIAHDYEGQKNISLKEVQFDDTMNKAFDIGSEQEKYELDTEDCKTIIVSDSQTLVPESQLVSLITEEGEKKGSKKKVEDKAKGKEKGKETEKELEKNKETEKEKDSDKNKATEKEADNPAFDKTQ